jgi:hypothetical protein
VVYVEKASVIGSNHGERAELHTRGVGQGLRKRDAGGHRRFRSGTKRPVGAAEAAAEGGFLGFGGVQVSEAEKATLADIAKALGVDA